MHGSTASSQSSSFGFQTPIQPSNPVTQVAQLKPANPAALCKEFSAQSLVSSLAQSSLASSYPSTPEPLLTLLPLPIHLRVSQDKDQGSIPYRVSHCSDQVVRIKVRAWNTPHALHCKTLGVIVHSEPSADPSESAKTSELSQIHRRRITILPSYLHPRHRPLPPLSLPSTTIGGNIVSFDNIAVAVAVIGRALDEARLPT